MELQLKDTKGRIYLPYILLWGFFRWTLLSI